MLGLACLTLALVVTATRADDPIDLPRRFPLDVPVYDLDAEPVEVPTLLGRQATVVFMLSHLDLLVLADELNRLGGELTPLTAMHDVLLRSIEKYADRGVSYVLLVETTPIAKAQLDSLALYGKALVRFERAVVRERERVVKQLAATVLSCEGLDELDAVVDEGGAIAARLGLRPERHLPGLLIVNTRQRVCYYDVAGDDDGPPTKLDFALESELRRPGSLPASAPR
jgi:hypothetical protein